MHAREHTSLLGFDADENGEADEHQMKPTQVQNPSSGMLREPMKKPLLFAQRNHVSGETLTELKAS